MKWRTDKPTADVIVVKIKYIGCYMVLMKKGQDYYSMDDDIGKTPLEAIEKWANLEEDEMEIDFDKINEQFAKNVPAPVYLSYDVTSLEKELDRYFGDVENMPNCSRATLEKVARHFFKFGNSATTFSKEDETVTDCDEWEDAFNKEVLNAYSFLNKDKIMLATVKDIARYFAKWGAEHLKK